MRHIQSVTVFTTPTCSWCKNVKLYLDSKKVKYDTIDLSENPDMQQELFKKTNQLTVPITRFIVDGAEDYVVGWQPARLASYVK